MTIDILGQGRTGDGLFKRLLASARFRYMVIAVFATILLSAQSVVARQPTLRTDLATLFVVYLAMEYPLFAGLVVTLIVGYVADVFSGEPRGLYMASLVILFLILRLIIFRIVGSRWFIVTAIAVLSTLIALLVRILIQSILGGGDTSLGDASPALFATFIAAAVLGYPIYGFLRWLDERFRRREEAM